MRACSSPAFSIRRNATSPHDGVWCAWIRSGSCCSGLFQYCSACASPASSGAGSAMSRSKSASTHTT
eukprot:6386149-Prymnesium_polylepis.1